MKTRLLTGIVGATMLMLPALGLAQDDKKPSPVTSQRAADSKSSGMSADMREAIAWERAKDRAAARQARIEARRSGGDQNAANRVMDDKDQGRQVKDTKAPGSKKDQ
jgi:hypothetical protein